MQRGIFLDLIISFREQAPFVCYSCYKWRKTSHQLGNTQSRELRLVVQVPVVSWKATCCQLDGFLDRVWDPRDGKHQNQASNHPQSNRGRSWKLLSNIKLWQDLICSIYKLSVLMFDDSTNWIGWLNTVQKFEWCQVKATRTKTSRF